MEFPARRKAFPGLLIIVILIAAIALTAQEVKRPPLVVPATGDSAAQFAPPGWRLEAEKVREADLNGDGKPDAAFVISNGGSGEGGDNEPPVVKHVLVLAFRGPDNRLHRSVVSDATVLDGDEGGVFGDPFDDLTVENGAVVIGHYGGSRERWNFTHRYRWQNGQWTLIGLSIGSTDTLNLEHYDSQDINLSTGLVEATEKGGYDGGPQKPLTSGSYYELEVYPADRAPTIDGRVSTGEWPGYTLRLDGKQQVYRNGRLWRGANDLSIELHAVRIAGDLFICAQVKDDDVTAGDAVRLVNKRGLTIRPRESRKVRAGEGYVFEARYSLKEIATAAKRDDKYAVENLEMALDPSGVYAETEGFQLPASVEVRDVDRSGIRSVLSTRIAGSPYPGAIRIFRKGTLILTSDIEP